MTDDITSEVTTGEAAFLPTNLLDAASERFDDMCQERWTEGAEKYGPLRFLEADTIEMALEELADLSNYARMTFIRLELLRAQLSTIPRPEEVGPQSTSNPHARG